MRMLTLANPGSPRTPANAPPSLPIRRCQVPPAEPHLQIIDRLTADEYRLLLHERKLAALDELAGLARFVRVMEHEEILHVRGRPKP